jgi:putative OPT family oligopeptide transporter
VACAEVLEVGDRGGGGVVYVFVALGAGIVFKFLGTHGFSLIKGTVAFAKQLGGSALYFGCDISAALVAVGYIVGFNVALLVFLGGAIGWLLGIPIYYLVTGVPPIEETLAKTMHDTWSHQIRFMGVGAMVVGGVWSIIGVRKGIVAGVRGAVAGYRAARGGESSTRTQRDLHVLGILSMFVPTTLAIFALYIVLTGTMAIGLVAGAVMIVAAFFFVAVSSYIVGLVGSSNNPVSGMTISTVLFASLLLLMFGMSGTQGMIAALGVAGVVCCAACTAGDVSQDLKTGYLVGASPYKQQWAQVIGVLASAFIIAPILGVLHSGYGIGIEVRSGVDFLKAPQAGLFASIVQAMFGKSASLPWAMVAIGALVGIALIVSDEILRRKGSSFRTYVMPVAVGIYLPWALGVAIFLGGVAAVVTGRLAGKARRAAAIHRGVLIGSGLIAGEALAGIVIAMLIVTHVSLPKVTLSESVTDVLSVVLLLVVVGGMTLAGVKGRTDTPTDR